MPNNSNQVVWSVSTGLTLSALTGASNTVSWPTSLSSSQTGWVIMEDASAIPIIRDTVEFVLNPPPNVYFSLTDSIFLKCSDTVALNGSPVGGSYYIDGNPMIGNTLFPSTLSEGLHTITYSLLDQTGCTASVSQNFSVVSEIDFSLPPDGNVVVEEVMPDGTTSTLTPIQYAGVTTFSACNTSSGTFKFSTTTALSGYDSLFVMWGDDSTSYAFPQNGVFELTHQYGQPGMKIVRILLSDSVGCSISSEFGLYYGSISFVNISFPWNPNYCFSLNDDTIIYDFQINSWENDPDSVEYTFNINDGNPDVVLRAPLVKNGVSRYPHRIVVINDNPLTIAYRLYLVEPSCGFYSDLVDSNAYHFKAYKQSPCTGLGYNWGTAYGPILISQSPKAGVDGEERVLVGEYAHISDQSLAGNMIYEDENNDYKCSNSTKGYWKILKADGTPMSISNFSLDTSSTLGVSNTYPGYPPFWTSGTNTIDISFNHPGIYFVRRLIGLTAHSSVVFCSIDSADWTVCVDTVPRSRLLNDLPAVVALDKPYSLNLESSAMHCGPLNYAWTIKNLSNGMYDSIYGGLDYQFNYSFDSIGVYAIKGYVLNDYGSSIVHDTVRATGFSLDDGCIKCNLLPVGSSFFNGYDTLIVVDRSMLDSIIAAQGDLSKVCVSHVTDMNNLFRGQAWFNQNIGAWDVSNVTNMNRMFKKARAFDQPLGKWDVSGVRRMNEMFASASSFNQDLSSWCVKLFQYNKPTNFATGSRLSLQHRPRWGNCPQDFDNVASLATGGFINSSGCVDCSALNIGDYFEINGDTMLVVDRPMLDSLVLLHDDLSKVCVSHITDMTDALRGLQWFNTDISSWDVSNVTNMSNMFWKTQNFNQDIGNWDVSNVQRMSRMFKLAKAFNQDIGYWDVSSVERFQEMFRNADSFNQDIGYWNVGNVLGEAQMVSMFRSADSFNQNLSNWCVENVENRPAGFDANSPLSTNLLPQWGDCPSPQADFSQDTLSFCGLDSVLLDARGGFDAYSWNTGDTTRTIHIKQSGYYHVTTWFNGQTSLDSVFVSLVHSSLKATTEKVLCSDDSVQISSVNNLASADSLWYNWSTGDTTATIVVNAVQSTTYYCQITDGITTCTDSVTINVGISQHPSDVTVDPIAADSAHYAVTHIPNVTYQWEVSSVVDWLPLQDSSSFYVGGRSSELTLRNINANFDGLQFRCVLNSTNCSQTSDPALLTVLTPNSRTDQPITLTQAVQEFMGNQSDSATKLPFVVHPNPTSGLFSVWPQTSGQYTLMDASGKLLEQGHTQPVYDLSAYSNGMYILRITMKQETHLIRVIKQ